MITWLYKIYIRQVKLTHVFFLIINMAVCQNLVPLVNIKIAGKWMFIPLKMVLIGIDPYPHVIKYQPGQNRVSSLLPGWETDQCRWGWSLMIYQRRMVTCSLRKWSNFQRFRDIARYIRYMPMIYHFYPLSITIPYINFPLTI